MSTRTIKWVNGVNTSQETVLIENWNQRHLGLT